MSKAQNFYDTVNGVVGEGVNRGFLQLFTEDISLNGSLFNIGGKQVVNFGSCSYLGLEFDERMKRGAIRAIEEYGTQFSAARVYVSSRHYEELEAMTDRIFGGHTLVAPTTTLAHIATVPVIINDEDAVILDHQAHNSMQNAVNLVKPRGVHVEMIRHNNMEMLESRVKELRQKHRRIWYFADGIYSMYGDASPVDDVYFLMDKYPELHYYVDDAHGMSCFGKHGRGYVLSKKPLHEKLVFVSSFAKAFATGGAVIVFQDKSIAQKIRNSGAPFLSSGPMQPASLGAAIESAKIHLSDEIYSLQEDLQQNIMYTNLMLKKYNMPSVSENNSPVFFVGVGLPAMGFNMIKRLLNEGFYTNIGIFPTVPMKNTGVRFTITRLNTFAQIENMIATMAKNYPLALEDEGFSMEKVYKAFKMTPPEEKKTEEKVSTLINQSLKLKFEHYETILDIKKDEWNLFFEGKGSFDWEGMNFLESCFSPSPANPIREGENIWDFDYVIVRDLEGRIVLATFLTTALVKDDMLAPAEISAQIEEKRLLDKYYLCTKTIICGSLLTEGEHLYIDRTSPYWKDALKMLFEKIAELQEKYKASNITLRDFDSNDVGMDSFFAENGFFKTAMPENHVVENFNTVDFSEYFNKLSHNSRDYWKRYVLRHEHKYETEIITPEKNCDIEHLYQLYMNVKNRSFSINTFTIPFKFFENISKNPNWEIVQLKLKPEFDYTQNQKPVASAFCNKSGDSYNFILSGVDYECPREHNAYRQSLYQIILRAKQLGKKAVRMGFTATMEKRKFGAKVFTPCAYVQLKDNYNMEVLGNMSALRKANR